MDKVAYLEQREQIEAGHVLAREQTYLIRSRYGGESFIKIGKSVDPKRRLGNLQSAHAKPLELLAVMDGDNEPWLHALFTRHRQMGEWFVETPGLLLLAEKINEVDGDVEWCPSGADAETISHRLGGQYLQDRMIRWRLKEICQLGFKHLVWFGNTPAMLYDSKMSWQAADKKNTLEMVAYSSARLERRVDFRPAVVFVDDGGFEWIDPDDVYNTPLLFLDPPEMRPVDRFAAGLPPFSWDERPPAGTRALDPYKWVGCIPPLAMY